MYIFIILLVILILIIILSKINNTEYFENNSIPKIIYQTYYDKSKIPNKVYNNINKYAKGYKHKIFNDKECIEFIKNNFNTEEDKENGISYDKIINSFNNLKRGAHKADLFRYCLLYKKGGVYMDIKTELIKPINNLFDKNYFYLIYTKKNDRIYNGIMACSPNKKIFIKLIKQIINNSNKNIDYFLFLNYFTKLLTDELGGKIKLGLNKGKDCNYYIYKETCNKNKNMCGGSLDRYNLCCHINDNDEQIIKVRFNDFGRTW